MPVVQFQRTAPFAENVLRIGPRRAERKKRKKKTEREKENFRLVIPYPTLLPSQQAKHRENH